MNLEIIILSKVIYLFYFFIYLESKKNDINEFIYETDSQTYGYLRGWGGGTNQELGINRNTLLNSIGNYILYPIINHNGKEYEKNIYIGITLLYTRN